MATLTFTDPTVGSPNSTEDPKINTALDAIKTWSTQIDKGNLAVPSGIVKLPSLADLVIATGSGSFQPSFNDPKWDFNFAHGLGKTPTGWKIVETTASDGSLWAGTFARGTSAPTSTTVSLRAYPYWYNTATATWVQAFASLVTYNYNFIVWG